MNQRSPLFRLLDAMRDQRRTVWLATLCSILNKLWDLAPPVLIGAAVDVVVQRKASFVASLGFVEIRDQLIFLAVATVVIWGLESIFEYLYAWYWRTLAQVTQHTLRVKAYSHIQDLELAWFGDQRRGELMSILNDDINQLERFLDEGANDLLQVGTTVITVGIAFFVISPQVAVWAVLPIPIIVWASFRFQSRIAPRYATVRQRVGELNAALDNNLAGIETIKSFTTESLEADRINALSGAYQDANRSAIRLSAAFSPLIRMAIVIGFTATLVVGGWQTIDGEIAVGSYSVLIFLTQRLLWPLTRLGRTFDLYQRAMASTARVLDLLDTPLAMSDGDTELVAATIQGDLEFADISFGYPGRDAVLRDFSLSIPSGQTVALVGATGAGKTTVIRLLLRFYDPSQGTIRLDGQPISDFTLNSLRSSIALVSQHPILFPGTVRDNITYGRPTASMDSVIHAARVAEAHGFIEVLPNGYDTQVGEDGHKLSGGQRQRIAIARAVLKEAPILIFDEATSAVDNETEAALQRSLEAISQDRTTLIIAHRLSTIRHAHQIIVLDSGRVAEGGTHDELVASNGLYARLWRVQTGGGLGPS